MSRLVSQLRHAQAREEVAQRYVRPTSYAQTPRHHGGKRENAVAASSLVQAEQLLVTYIIICLIGNLR